MILSIYFYSIDYCLVVSSKKNKFKYLGRGVLFDMQMLMLISYHFIKEFSFYFLD